MRSLVCSTAFALLASGCVTEAECGRRVTGAERQALEDARDCSWRPSALLTPACAGVDRRPLRAYEGVFCSQATLSCIRGDSDAFTRCFGGPNDTGVDPIVTLR